MLEVRELSYSVRDRKILRNISASFSPGQLYAVVGPNGSGKTSFLKNLCQIWSPESGQVLWKENDLKIWSRKQISSLMSLVPQDFTLNLSFTVEEIVRMGLYPRKDKLNLQEQNQELDHALKQVNALEWKKRIASELSNGEKQRVLIARALATGSQVLLLDEPTSNLDPLHHLQIWELCKELLKLNKTIIINTHDLNMAFNFANEVLMFQSGQILKRGCPQKTLSSKNIKTVFNIQEDTLSEHIAILENWSTSLQN